MEKYWNRKSFRRRPEAGGSTSETGKAVTKHQEELPTSKQKRCAGNHRNNSACCGAASPHQEKVTGKRSVQDGDHDRQARKISESGDEQGCMKKGSGTERHAGIQ
jgi:hypothetical protein